MISNLYSVFKMFAQHIVVLLKYCGKIGSFMNKVLSQAIKKVVSEFTPKVVKDNKDKRPDYSLNNKTELFQNSKGITIKIDRS